MKRSEAAPKRQPRRQSVAAIRHRHQSQVIKCILPHNTPVAELFRFVHLFVQIEGNGETGNAETEHSSSVCCGLTTIAIALF